MGVIPDAVNGQPRATAPLEYLLNEGEPLMDRTWKENPRRGAPAKTNAEECATLQRNAILLHKLIGAQGITRSDFILGQDGEIYALEINSNVGLSRERRADGRGCLWPSLPGSHPGASGNRASQERFLCLMNIHSWPIGSAERILEALNEEGIRYDQPMYSALISPSSAIISKQCAAKIEHDIRTIWEWSRQSAALYAELIERRDEHSELVQACEWGLTPDAVALQRESSRLGEEPGIGRIDAVKVEGTNKSLRSSGREAAKVS